MIKINKIFSNLILCSFFALITISNSAFAESVNYIDADGSSKTADATALTSGVTAWESGWYFVKETVDTDMRASVSGVVHLILTDNCNMTVNGGIRVSNGNSLVIYGQNEGNGHLTITSDYGAAGIGGDDETNNGACGEITINGGIIDVSGGGGSAGIGGGEGEYDANYAGTFILNGGTINAEGGDGGAGIGAGLGGKSGGVLKSDYNRAKVTVNSINAERSGFTGTLEINYSDTKYIDRFGETLTIKNPITARDKTELKDKSWYIAGSDFEIDSRIKVNGSANLILADGFTMTANKGIDVSFGNQLTIYCQPDKTGNLITVKDDSPGIGNSSSCGTIVINGGNIFVTAKEGAAPGIGGDRGYIKINNGTVKAKGGEGCAGIGGTHDSSKDGIVFITGGTVNATGGEGAAGIGGGSRTKKGWRINIFGGIVNATGGKYGPGIGNGSSERIGNSLVDIRGGIIEATGGEGAAGIGGGYRTSYGEVRINGGIIDAFGGEGAPGIGGGSDSNNNGSLTSYRRGGKSWINADSIGSDTKNFASGVLFNGNNGVVYGSPYLLESHKTLAYTVPKGKTLTIESDQTLTIGSYSSLTIPRKSKVINNGKIINYGTIYGKIDGNDAVGNGVTQSSLRTADDEFDDEFDYYDYDYDSEDLEGPGQHFTGNLGDASVTLDVGKSLSATLPVDIKGFRSLECMGYTLIPDVDYSVNGNNSETIITLNENFLMKLWAILILITVDDDTWDSIMHDEKCLSLLALNPFSDDKPNEKELEALKKIWDPEISEKLMNDNILSNKTELLNGGLNNLVLAAVFDDGDALINLSLTDYEDNSVTLTASKTSSGCNTGFEIFSFLICVFYLRKFLARDF